MNAVPTAHGNVARDYPDYLRDESRMVGRADSISFPKTEEKLRERLVECSRLKTPVTIQGARTGITGGAVPLGGHVINLSRMDRILGMRFDPAGRRFFLACQPGLLLSALRERLAAKDFDSTGWSTESLAALEEFRKAGLHFFTPDPTETGASLGGMVAANASGARSFFYGPTRDYVEGLRALLADGAILDLRRSRDRAQGRRFDLRPDSGRTIRGELPGYAMPGVKNASGYFARDNMDMLDLFIGAEGTLGAVSQIEIRLFACPGAMWGLMLFFQSEPPAIEFVKQTRAEKSAYNVNVAAIEFFDRHALDLLREQKKINPAFKEIPAMPVAWHTAVYVEYHADSESAVEEAATAASERFTARGGNEDATWLASDEREMERLKTFRHAVPEAVNLLIDERRKKNPEIAKLGADFAVPDAELDNVLAIYHRGLNAAGLRHVIFGHIGDNHLHVNILPDSVEEYRRGKELYLEWARAVVKIGGSVSAEHGIGKLKTALLREMCGEAGIAQMLAVKRLLDPDLLLNRGNLFAPQEER
ncbi:MAG: FAD-binding oxidoreductase [Verrucomicrobiota bacterium]|nr:FAD-binding oxidoreductase [Verrucomicrobiota bacterium]